MINGEPIILTMTKQLKVLFVEDNEDDSELLNLELESRGYSIIYERVDTITAMEEALERQQWDVILSDYSMPKFGAPAALRLLQTKRLDIPFIVVSGSIGEETAVALMKAGAHDYLSKNNLVRLLPVVEREIREAKIRQERKQALDMLEHLAFYDKLTNLPNRTLFLHYVQDWIDYSQEQANLFAIVFLDIDRYKHIKYGFGHAKSEQFLIEIAHRLEKYLQPKNHLARVGEDEFGVLLRDMQSFNHISNKVAELHEFLELPFQVEQSLIYSSVCVGIVDSTAGYTQAEDFLQAADTATHNAKKEGIGHTVFFDVQMQANELARLQLETDLQDAIRRQQLHLNYQPIVSLKAGKVVGFEALLRWQHPTQGWISPSKFIPLAEQTGLIIPLGEWALTEACRQLNSWQEQFDDTLLSVAVNLSGIQLIHPNFMDTIQRLYQTFDSQQIQLKLEITESVLMERAEIATAALEKLKANNIQIYIDDFGTGYSSLSYLHCLPIDAVKIDRSFINRMTEDAKNFNIVKAIMTLAHTLGLKVVAEGIETQEQMELLQSLSCDYGQGYYFSKPLPPNLIREQKMYVENCLKSSWKRT